MRKPTLAAALAGCLLAAPLTSCSGDDDKKSDAKGDSSPSASETSPGVITPSDVPTPPVVKNEKGAITDLTMGECQTEAGKQSVKGELTSSAKKAADFLVTVSWTTPTGDVLGRGFKVFQDLAPGDTVKFTITAQVEDGATQCVKGVSYGRIR